MKLMVSGSIAALILASSAFANIIPFDPHIIYATGGDATPIDTNGISVNLSDGGGGIFVFENDTGNDLTNLDVKVQFFFSNGIFPRKEMIFKTRA